MNNVVPGSTTPSTQALAQIIAHAISQVITQPSPGLGLLKNGPTVGPTAASTTDARFDSDLQTGALIKKRLFRSARELIDNVKPAQWVVKGLLERDAMGLLYGPPGEGKSFLTVSLACCVATGTLWHGSKVATGPVVYISGEGQGGMGRRLAAWERANGVDPVIGGNLHISERAVPMLDEAAAREVVEEVNELCAGGPGPSLVIIDTVARAFTGGDENSTQDMTTFINHVDIYLRQPWGAHVLLVHHTGHEGGRARGNSALKGALDQEFSIVKDNSKIRSLSCTKMKDAQEPEPRCFSLDVIHIGDGVDNFGDIEKISSCVMRSLDASARPVARVAAGGTAITPVDLLKYLVDEWPGVEMLSKSLGVGKKAVDAALKVCADRGLIRHTNGGKGRGWELTSKGMRLNNMGSCSIAPEESATIQ